VNRHARDNQDNKATLLGCRHLGAMKNLMEQFANNFNYPTFEEKMGQKRKALHKEDILKKGVLLIVLTNEEEKDATSFCEEDEDEMPIVTKRDIQEFKDTKNVLSVSIFKFMRH
jgi:hypothetical protein